MNLNFHISLTQATHFFTNLKRRISDNAEHLNGFHQTIKQINQSFEQDPFRLAFSPICNPDLGFGSIESVPTTQLIRNLFPKEGVYKTIVSPDKLEIISNKSFFYNPRTGTLDGGIPMVEVSPAIIENHSLMMEFINRHLGVTPMSNELISSQGTMWKALNNAAESLINGFMTELGGLEAHCAGIIGYDASDCVLHILMSQTPDSISFIYGNLFTIVKLGGSFRKLWINYHIWDGLSVFLHTSVVPDSIQELVKGLYLLDKIEGHHIIKFREALRYDFQSSSIFQSSDILERVGPTALGLKGIVPNPVGGVI